jgi:endonuclease/exonuclease/phosphatase family metal-dependent hydrolase
VEPLPGNVPPSQGRRLVKQLKLLTYNIHCGIGVDRCYDLRRIETILGEEQADLIALQEMDCGVSRTAYQDQCGYLADRLSMNHFYCATRAVETGEFGLAVLSPFHLVHKHKYDISYHPDREPRYCLRVDVEVEPGAVLHVFNCHLGLATRERRYQRQQMLSEAILLSEDLRHPVILMGDFNDRPFTVVHYQLRRHFKDVFNALGKWWGPTFRAGPFPLRLDHIYVSPDIHVVNCRVRRDKLARIASDHRPVISQVEVEWQDASGRQTPV